MTEIKYPCMIDMPDKEYFKHPAIDQTSLKNFITSPREYAWKKLHHDYDSPALQFGKAAHSLVLGSGPTVEERLDRRTKEGKLQAKHCETEETVALSKTDYERLMEMTDYAPDMSKLAEGKPEIALFATDPTTGLHLKGKIDWLPDTPDRENTMWLYDYKTTGHDATDFTGSAYKFGYHIQAAFYMRLYRLVSDWQGRMGFRFVVQEKEAPYDWMVWEFKDTDPEIIQVAEQQIDKALNGLKFYIDNDIPLSDMLRLGHPKMPTPIRFTDWQMNHLIGDDEQWRM